VNNLPKMRDFLKFTYSPTNVKPNPHRPILNWENRPKSDFSLPIIGLSTSFTINSQKIIENIQNKTPFIKTDYEKYQSKSAQPWKNRIIHGDSLLSMASLYNKGLKNRIQMIYMDPPFGIQYKANYKVGKQDVEGYNDSWENGLASYLEYMRKRLVLCRELLTQSGSIFIQIGETNIHYVRVLMDEIFGPENFISLITFRTAISTNNIQNISDYLLWYARDKSQVLRRQLFTKRSSDNLKKTFTYKETNEDTNEIIKFKPQELVKRINSGKEPRMNRLYSITHHQSGKKYSAPKGFEWRWDKSALEELNKLNRLVDINGKLYGKRYIDDFPMMLMTNLWADTATSTFAARKHYTVHTNPKVIKRCIAMTTRPGDIVLDPTSGSGTTAIVAENLERKWIVMDTSPQSILSSINWLLGTIFPVYKWNQVENDFKYTEVKKISLSNLTHNRKSKTQYQFDNPKIDKKIKRIASEFSLQMIKSDLNLDIVNILEKNGIMLPSGKKLEINSMKQIKNSSKFMDMGILCYNGDCGKIPLNVYIIQSSEKGGIESQLSIIFANIKENEDQSHLILINYINLKLIANYIKLTGEIRDNHESKKRSIMLGIIHPDLMINELNSSNHPESVRLIGQIVKDEESRINVEYHDISKRDLNKSLLLSPKDIAIWGIINNSSKSDIQWINLPFYHSFLAKDLKIIYGNGKSPNDLPQKILQMKAKSPNSIIFAIDNRGTPHFGL
jgi:DNA modification methylase